MSNHDHSVKKIVLGVWLVAGVGRFKYDNNCCLYLIFNEGEMMKKANRFKQAAQVGFAMTSIALLVAGCGGGGVAAAAAAKTAIGGVAFKGDFDTTATVAACPLTAAVAAANNCAGSATSAAGAILAGGKYTLNNVTWAGPTLVVVTGKWLNEVTGVLSTTPGTLTSVVILPAVGANFTANINMATAMAADSLLKQVVAQSGVPVSNIVDANAVSVAKDSVMSALGLTGNPDVLANTGPLLAVSTMFANILQSGGNPADVVASLSADLVAGVPLGTTPASGVAAFNAASLVAAASSAGVTNPTALTALQGIGVLPAFTAGSGTRAAGTLAACTIVATGSATCQGNASAANPVLSFNLVDLTVVSSVAKTYPTTLTFGIADAAAAGKRTLSGTVPVSLTTDGAGNVALQVAAGAVLNFSGTDATGAAVSGSATNVAANVITSGANGSVALDVGQLVATAQAKAGAAVPPLATLTLPGTYNVKVSVGGSIGLANASGTALTQLFPLTQSGRTITATLTTQ